MSPQGRYFDRIASFESEHFVIELNLKVSLENKKELPCTIVEMSHFSATSRDAFLNHSQIGSIQETPAVTDFSPSVMFRR